MKNGDLINNFLNGWTEGKGSHLQIEGRKLYNYSTCIAYRTDCEGFILNGERYSQTTTKHQNQIRREAKCLTELDTESDFKKHIHDKYNEWV